MTDSKNKVSVQASRSLALWTGINYSGSPLQLSNGQAGILAADSTVWSYKSVGITSMQLFVWTAPNTTTPGYSFHGHIESLLSSNQNNLPTRYPGAEFPLQYVGIDPLLVGVLMVSIDSGDNPLALSLSQTYPVGSAPLNTFAAPGINGALGFFSLTTGSSITVNVQYGDYVTANQSVTWSGNGSLSIGWNGTTPTINYVSGLPANWRFGTPTKQSDGSWLLALSVGVVNDTGTLYTGTNFTGSSKHLVPHTLTPINSGIGWTYSSLKLADMPALIYSAFAPTNASYVYSGYDEQLFTTDIANFATAFSGSTPVNLLSLDNTDVVVYLNVLTTNTDDSAWVITQTYPQTFYTYASTTHVGVLAVLPASGASQAVTVSYGSLDNSGHYTQTNSGTLNISLKNGVPQITPAANWPEGTTFSKPQQQPDGSWSAVVSDLAVIKGPALYPQVNYGGTPLSLIEHQSVELRNLASTWQYNSLRVNGLHWLSHTLYEPQSTTYDYRKYRDNYNDADVPDISKGYTLASAAINGIVLGPNDVVVQVKLKPTDTSQNQVLSASQSWPKGFYTAATVVAGVAQQGVLIVFDKTQALHTIPVQLGVLNADGTASWQTSTTVTARWDNNQGKPIVTLSQDAPADWQLSAVQATGQANEFSSDLTFDNGVNITMYAITDAPSISKIDGYPFSSRNTIVLHSNKAATVTLQLSGNAKFSRTSSTNMVVDLPALSMTQIDVNDQTVEKVTVTLTGANITTQTTTLNFTNYPIKNNMSLAANSGAPANGGVENTVYIDTVNLGPNTVHVTLSGNAVFADTLVNNKIFPLISPYYGVSFGIINTVAETVTVTAILDDNTTQSTTSTFVKIATPVTSPVAVSMYPVTNAPDTTKITSYLSNVVNNKVVLYSNKPITATLQLAGGGQFRANDQSTYVFILPALEMTSVEIYNAYDTRVTVTLSADNITTQSTTLDFKAPVTSGNYRLGTTTGAPATGGVINNVYLESVSPPDYSELTITLSGSAVFASTQQNSKVTYLDGSKYSFLALDIVDTVAETVNVSIQSTSGSKITTSTTFVPV